MNGMEAAPRVWVVRGGRDDEIAQQLIEREAVAISFRTTFDLSLLPTRGDVLTKLEAARGEHANTNVAGQMFRFAHEIEEGDVVLTPQKRPRLVHVSYCAGRYSLDSSVFGSHPHYLHVLPLDHMTSIAWLDFPTDVRKKLSLRPTVFRADAAWPFLQPRLAGAGAARKPPSPAQ